MKILYRSMIFDSVEELKELLGCVGSDFENLIEGEDYKEIDQIEADFHTLRKTISNAEFELRSANPDYSMIRGFFLMIKRISEELINEINSEQLEKELKS